MKALFIGRFQPFHNGHLQVIKKISKKYDEIIIGIGSSQYDNSIENPFTAEERKKMIDETLLQEDISNYKVVFIPDIHNPPKWVEHIKSIVSDFDVVLSNNSFTTDLFEKKGYSVEKTGYFQRESLKGREIRRRMHNSEKWEELVPKPVLNIIKNKNEK